MLPTKSVERVRRTSLTTEVAGLLFYFLAPPPLIPTFERFFSLRSSFACALLALPS